MNEPCAVTTVLISSSMEMRAVPTLAMDFADYTRDPKIQAVSVTSIFVLNY
jgi:hypothetical protein